MRLTVAIAQVTVLLTLFLKTTILVENTLVYLQLKKKTTQTYLLQAQ